MWRTEAREPRKVTVPPNVGPETGKSDEVEQLGRPEERTAPPVETDDRSKLRPDKLD